MSDLLGRVLVAALLAPVALGCVWLGGVAMLALALRRRARSRWTSSSAWAAGCARSR